MRMIQFAHLFLFALVTGVFWGTWFSLSRSIASITPGTFLEVGRTMIRNLGLPMSILLPAALLSAVPVIVWRYRRRQSAALVLASAGAGLLLVALAITLSVNVPIDNEIARWTIDTLPSDWAATRDRWEFFHGARTFASVTGLGCALGSVLWPRAAHGDMHSRR